MTLFVGAPDRGGANGKKRVARQCGSLFIQNKLTAAKGGGGGGGRNLYVCTEFCTCLESRIGPF